MADLLTRMLQIVVAIFDITVKNKNFKAPYGLQSMCIFKMVIMKAVIELSLKLSDLLGTVLRLA